nr:Crp/Fnr family transcriptional regulator [uncultured Sellimonas sp.]
MTDIKKNCDLYEIIRIVNRRKQNKKNDLAEIKKHLNDQMKIRVIKPGGSISCQDIAGKYVYYVIEGQYYHYRNSNTGKRNVVALYKGPQWIGIDRALDMEKSNVTEDYVLRKTVVIDIKSEYFVQCIREDGELALHIIKNLLAKMSSASSRVDYMLFNDARTQTIFWFSEYWKINDTGGEECTIALKNENIAEAIGISTRTLYRVIRELKEENLVTTKKGNIVINSLQMQQMIDSVSK